MGKYLGIDYGTKRVGIAVSDDDKTFSFARRTLENKDIESLTSEIKEICHEEEVEKIILGLPVNMKGERTPWTKKVEAFSVFLKNTLNISVEFQDERLTSQMSYSLFRDKKSEQKMTKCEIDEQSARIILQDYIDRNSLK